MSKKSNKYAGDQPAAYDPTGISEYLGLGRPIDFDKKPVRYCYDVRCCYFRCGNAVEMLYRYGFRRCCCKCFGLCFILPL